LEVLDKYKIISKNKANEYPIVLLLDLVNCQVGIENQCVQDEANVLYKLSRRWNGVLRFLTKLERWGKIGEHPLQYMEFFLEIKKCEIWKVIGRDPNYVGYFKKCSMFGTTIIAFRFGVRRLFVLLISILWGDYTWKYIGYWWKKNANVFLDVKLRL